MNSIQSNALEPTRSELKHLSGGQKIMRLLPTYGLVILTAVLILLFSVLLPNTFPTLLNLRSIISDKAIILILSLGVMIPMSAGRIDLTVGYGIVLWHILAISLQTLYGFSWPLAVLTVLLLGALMGMLNGLLVEVAKIDSFIATLGTGTVLYALALWHSGGRQIVGVLPDNFYALEHHHGLWPADHRLLRHHSRAADVVRLRIHAAGPLSLCHWRKPEGRRAQRHSSAQICDGLIHRIRSSHGTGGCVAGGEAAHRTGQRGS